MTCPKCGGRVMFDGEPVCINCARVVAPPVQHVEPIYGYGDPSDPARHRKASKAYRERQRLAKAAK